MVFLKGLLKGVFVYPLAVVFHVLFKCYKKADAVRTAQFRRKYKIDKSVKINVFTSLNGEGEIVIGKNTYLGKNCFIVSHPKDCTIEIGENCAISHNVQIRAMTYDPQKSHIPDRKTVSSDIKIGSNVWIGSGVYINKGVTIGDNAVIGANSVVMADVDPMAIVAGSPAQMIKVKS